MTTESVVLELTGVVSNLKTAFEEHREDDKKNFKYAHHMLEDLGAEHANFRLANLKDQTDMQKLLSTVEERLRWIERLVWVVLIGVFSIVGSQIMKALG